MSSERRELPWRILQAMDHAYVIEAGADEGIDAALSHLAAAGMPVTQNPDLISLRFGLLTVDDARRISTLAAQAPIAGERKALVIAANRAYYESQNALLKLFEEPPAGTSVYLILPSLGQLLPTLRSRVQILARETGSEKEKEDEAREFLAMDRDGRSRVIKRLTNGKDEEERRANRDEAVALVNGIERIAYERMGSAPDAQTVAMLRELAQLRGYLHERSAPLKMILEHVAIAA